MSESAAKKEWTKKNTVFVGLKLNKHTDADILAHIGTKAQKQTYIKQLIRQDIAKSQKAD